MLIKFGSIVTRGSGKLGGHVYSTNRGGAYVRTNQTPSNPQTPFQQSGRAVFTQLTQGWSALTEAERTSWNQATSSFPVTDRFGDSRELSGKGLYISLNKELVLVGKAILNVAPSPGPILVPSDIVVINSPINSQIDIRVPSLPGNTELVISASGVVSAGTSFVKNRMRVLFPEFIPNLQDLDENWTAYVNRFGTPAEGDKIFWSAYTVNSSGQRSPSFTQANIVAE